MRKTTVSAFAAIFIAVLVLCVCVLAGFLRSAYHGEENDVFPPEIKNIDSNGICIDFRAENGYFFANDSNSSWKFIYLKGVNMGLTEAATDLSNPNVSYETYTEWFGQISEMNANTVKVFTVMPPQFYEALYDFNLSSDKPLYLLQGIWFNENYMYDCDNAFSDDGIITQAFCRAAKESVDIIHGNSDYTDYGEIKNAVYKCDISPYLAGYILGLEWDADFVKRTNACVLNKGYEGEYLYTADDASAFESFLCEVGDYLISYETEKYNAQSPLAFLNWMTTDTITHTNEPFPEEDAVTVNTENILACDQYYSGLFAAIDVYPYYPEFMNYQPEYILPDDDGNINPYRAYLCELIGQYSVPVVIAETGLPTSRGSAHKSVMGYDQGAISEEEQGEYVSKMLVDIAECGYAGSMIFSWQDEWFKQTWNVYSYSPDDASCRTPNVQSAEQSYGILAMEPGETSICTIDGKDSEWIDIEEFAINDGLSVKAMWDEGYLYLCVKGTQNKGAVYLPIRITGIGSTESAEDNIYFDEAVDFLAVLDGEDNSRIKVDAYEDLFYYQYSVLRSVFERDESCERQGIGVYNTVRQFLSNEIVLPLDGTVIDPAYTYSGLLRFGTTDTESNKYDSLADFYFTGDVTEIRIPWYLLNVMNSTLGICLDDFHSLGYIDQTDIQSVKIGIGTSGQRISLFDIGYHTTDKSYFHTRLKKSYDILKETLSSLMNY